MMNYIKKQLYKSLTPEKKLKKAHNGLVAVLRDNKDVEVGVWLTRQDVINATARFMNEPELKEIYLDVKLRTADGSSNNT